MTPSDAGAGRDSANAAESHDRLSHDWAERTHLYMGELTRRQEDVLNVVRECGPVTARDVAYHLPIGEDSARGILARLESKSLIDATYTQTAGRARAYVARR